MSGGWWQIEPLSFILGIFIIGSSPSPRVIILSSFKELILSVLLLELLGILSPLWRFCSLLSIRSLCLWTLTPILKHIIQIIKLILLHKIKFINWGSLCALLCLLRNLWLEQIIKIILQIDTSSSTLFLLFLLPSGQWWNPYCWLYIGKWPYCPNRGRLLAVDHLEETWFLHSLLLLIIISQNISNWNTTYLIIFIGLELSILLRLGRCYLLLGDGFIRESEGLEIKVQMLKPCIIMVL